MITAPFICLPNNKDYGQPGWPRTNTKCYLCLPYHYILKIKNVWVYYVFGPANSTSHHLCPISGSVQPVSVAQPLMTQSENWKPISTILIKKKMNGL